MTEPTLYYVHDPMCSWCYALRPVWTQIQQQLPASIRVQYVLGGLAPDSDLPMPPETREYVQGQWHKIIQTVPGTEFNFDFWEKCQPRRSTYPACRAVLLAREQGSAYETALIHAIQDAYYRQARNPSDSATLYELAQQIGLDADAFAAKLHSDTSRKALLAEIRFARSIGGNSFPSLFLQGETGMVAIPHHYNDAEITLSALARLMD
ncbi:MAG: DsbA family protein [Gammaproteobacteria bacterium]|nr:DsbA family protein [Gammaproteobacteria bacterium]MBU1725213.1 DsbA family protein [Gammaproteobacteria bacterium]MBU2005664.1 DsbA family protein [Gammaproteobacteria bacterium]